MMEYKIEKMEAFKVIGMGREFSFENAGGQIPAFWDEFNAHYMEKLYKEMPNCCIGIYGISLEPAEGAQSFRYLIAGNYDGGKVLEGLEVVEIPAFTWAKFRCIGPMPETLQHLNQKIYSEWLPNNPKYEMASGYNIEMYSIGDIKSADYISEIWVPVKEK